MNLGLGSPFDCIESAHEFVTLLAETVTEAKRDLGDDVQKESSSNLSRRLDALRLTLYDLEKLELHLGSSSRILNDLRTLRHLLFEERASKARNFRMEAGARSVTRIT